MNFRSRTTLRSWALLALVLFVWDALGPAMAALAGVRSKSHFVEVCSSEGMKRVVVADPSEDGSGGTEAAFKSAVCPLCAVHAGQDAIDAGCSHVFTVDVLSVECPQRDFEKHVHPQFRTVPNPRGPPQHS